MKKVIIVCDRCGRSDNYTEFDDDSSKLIHAKDLCWKCAKKFKRIVEQFLNGQIHPEGQIEILP